MKNKFYITTPIYYVNDSPHIGHAYTTIACDVMARYMRLCDRDVKFLTGTDEHGQKVDKAAKAKNIDPQTFTDEVSERFRNLVDGQRQNDREGNLLSITNTDFIRTTEDRHKKAVQAFWERIESQSPDAIYKANYGGWYSVRDEAYYQEGELMERGGVRVAPTGAEVEWVEEESYFFRLSAYQEKLLDWFDAHPECVYPQSRLNEVRSFVAGGLKDLSISRTSFSWGVPVPNDSKHVMYVWIDALANYLTSAGFPDMENDEFDYWKNGATHVVGKDIVRFHAVYWPAFLIAANLPLPKRIIAHGWWTIEGEKMSKSLGNVLAPSEMIEKAGGVDQLRWFLMSAMPFGNDGNFSETRMIEVVNADLANNLGNLAQRTLSMVQKNCDGKVPSNMHMEKETLLQEVDRILLGEGDLALQLYEKFDYQLFAQRLMQAASKANEYIDVQAPWALKKTNPEKMEAVLYNLLEAIRRISLLLQPFCPTAANKLLDQLMVLPEDRTIKSYGNLISSGVSLPLPVGVFPRLEIKHQAA